MAALFQLDPGDGSGFQPAGEAVDASPGDTVNAKLVSTAGIDSGQINWVIFGTHGAAAPTLSFSGTPNKQIASFTVPAGDGQAFGIRLDVNGGADVTGFSADTAKSAVYVLENGVRPVFIGETFERDPVFGVVPDLNTALLSGGGKVTALVSGAVSSFGAADTIWTSDGSTAGGVTKKVTDPNVDPNAAIAGSKIVPNFVAQNVTTTGSGNFGDLASTGKRDIGTTYIDFGDHPYTVLDTDHRVNIDSTGGNITVLLTASVDGRELEFKDYKGNSTANNITIDGDGAETIDGLPTFVLDVDQNGVVIVGDDSNGWGTATRLPSAPAAITTDRVAHVDKTGNDGTGAVGNPAKPYLTISAALAAVAALGTPASINFPAAVSVNPGNYTEANPLVMQSHVDMVSRGANSVVIEPTTFTTEIVTGATDSVLSGFKLRGANGVGGIGYRSQSDHSTARNCVAIDCTTGYLSNVTADIHVAIENCKALRRSGETMDVGFASEDSATIHCEQCEAAGESGTQIGSGFKSSDTSQTHVHGGCVRLCDVGLHADAGLVEAHGVRVAENTTGRLIGPSANGIVRESASIGLNVVNDALVTGATAEFEFIGVQADLTKLTILADTKTSGMLSAPETDTQHGELQFSSDISIGVAGRPQVMICGRGGNTNVAMQCHQFDDSAASTFKFTDVTAQAISRTGSTFGYPGVTQTTDAIVIGALRKFAGIESQIDAIATTDGTFSVDYWTGAWTEMPPGGTRGSGIAAVGPVNTGGEYRANRPWETATGQEFMQFNAEIQANWISDTGTLDETPASSSPMFWVRIRPSVLPTILPILEQFVLIYSGTVNSASGLALQGDARARRSEVILGSSFEKGASEPGSQDIAYSTNIIIGGARNDYVNNAVDEAGLALPIPLDFDLSSPIEAVVEMMPSDGGAGNVEIEWYYATHSPTDVLAVGLPGPLTEFVDAQIVAVPGVIHEGFTTSHQIRIPNANPQLGDTLVIMIRRDATAGNGDDTYAGDVRVRSIRLNGLTWRLGAAAVS